MPIVDEFQTTLFQKSPSEYGQWYAVDLHNHTPSSYDYKGNRATAFDDAVARLKKSPVSVVMFTDHEKLPEAKFTNDLAKATGKLILRGAELNVFVDAWSKPEAKVGKQMFFHLLVGFAPDGKADYWIAHLYESLANEVRTIGTTEIKGFTVPVGEICDVLREAGAIVIPAHLHGGDEAHKSRSIDDIYDDREFLKLAKNHFSALEVTDPRTAEFFDGLHDETDRIEKACIRSSDAHDVKDIGSRVTYVEMERPTFAELRAALQLRFRVSLVEPPSPDSFVVGVHIRGSFYPDFWCSLSPHSNALIGVKGSGKTSLLECLRFALGSPVPTSRSDDVRSHLQAILGAAGTVEVLVKRRDGARVLIQRSINAPEKYRLTFEDDRSILVENPDALNFPSYILGWHEIEQAATDPNIRQVYLDTIAGREAIRQLEERATSGASRVQYLHSELISRYTTHRSLSEQIDRLEDLRAGLQELTDSDLIALKDSYEVAVRQRDTFQGLRDSIADQAKNLDDRLKALKLPINADAFVGSSPLAPFVKVATDALTEIEADVSRAKEDHSVILARIVAALDEQTPTLVAEFSKFSEQYAKRVSELQPEKRRLLETHRQVMEDTRALPKLKAEAAAEFLTIEKLIAELVATCNSVADSLDAQTSLRVEKVGELNRQLEEFKVHLEVARLARRTMFDELAGRYAAGANIYGELTSYVPNVERHHRRLARAYESLADSLSEGFSLILHTTEFTGYLGAFEGDDLKISFDVDRPGEKYTAIDQLSAGQRCTAVFPLLLKLREGPLILDQPEDNLDNRHIADAIAPALLKEKQIRQIAFTSHNANLVVLTDTEQIAVFESTGSEGVLKNRGYLCTPDSSVTADVIAILDGGRRALELRYQKYGTDPA